MLLGEFEPFCKRYQDGMFYVAKSVLHNDTMAEDAVQTALTRIFNLLGRLEFQSENQEKSYALRAAQNAAIDILEKEHQCEDILEKNMDARAVRRGDTTYQAVVVQETESEFYAAVKSLSPKAQTIFRYRELGLKDAEIADTLGITVSDVRVTVFRARQTVAKYLKERGLCCE